MLRSSDLLGEAERLERAAKLLRVAAGLLDRKDWDEMEIRSAYASTPCEKNLCVSPHLDQHVKDAVGELEPIVGWFDRVMGLEC